MATNSITTMHDGRVVLHHADCLTAMAAMEENSVDSVVCDPPYHLTSIVKRFGTDGSAPAKAGSDGAFQRASGGFMGKVWDGGDIAFQPETWAAVLRVLKPGGYIVAFASTRGFGRMSVAMEDAGFITHPMLAWIFGSGFPKATRIAADGYDGFRYGGQALKPALEPIYMGQKPFSEKTGTANILRWGTGAVNIDGCRVGETGARNNGRQAGTNGIYGEIGATTPVDYGMGRWPANIVHDGSDEVLAAFPDTKSGSRKAGEYGLMGYHGADAAPMPAVDGDSGSAARFFKTCELDDEDWVWLNLNLLPAPTAESYSLLSSEPAYTALVHAANEVLPEGLFCESLSIPPFTSATPTQLRRLAESFIMATQNIAGRFLREWQQERLSQKDSPVSVVATRSPTGTTQIIVSHWISSGCADPVIFNIMPTNSAAGERVCAPSTAGRFLYNPKASRADRDAGLEGFAEQRGSLLNTHGGIKLTGSGNPRSEDRKNTHPTVKPTSLMQWLCRLITPPGGVILDPFMGSGSTGKAAVLEGFQFVGCEREDEYMPIAAARIAWAIGATSKEEERPAVAPAQPAAAVSANDNQPADLFTGAA